MATDNSKHRSRQRGIITTPKGAVTVAFGPTIAGDVVVRLTLVEAFDQLARTTQVSLELDAARELRNTLNAVIGLITTDSRSS